MLKSGSELLTHSSVLPWEIAAPTNHHRLLSCNPAMKIRNNDCFPQELIEKVMREIKINNLDDYKNVRLVCIQWNEHFKSLELTSDLFNAEKMILKHPYMKRVFWVNVQNRVCVLAAKVSLSFLLNKISDYFGKGLNYTQEQVDQKNTVAEQRHHENTYIDSKGNKWLASNVTRIPEGERDSIGIALKLDLITWHPLIPITLESCNKDSPLVKWISWGIKVYQIYSIGLEIYSIYKHLISKSSSIEYEGIFEKHLTYPDYVQQDPELQELRCQYSGKVLMIPVQDNYGHRLDYVQVINYYIKKHHHCPTDRIFNGHKLDVKDLRFDLSAFKRIQKRIFELNQQHQELPSQPYFKFASENSE